MKVNDASEAMRFHVGSTIAGRYRVERPIGEGAMGAVALARHVTLDETVAIKFLKPELRRDPEAVARLSREAKALARIKSDHVARVLDVGVTLSVGPYMVMEYLEGTDLGEVLAEEGPLPVPRAVECMLQACEALTVAHTAGIVHRDLKPENLFLARHGRFETLKVLDFGIAEEIAVAEPGSATDLGLNDGEAPRSRERPVAAVYGTPSYMAPERVRNDGSADHRADIWSLGVVLHELVTGRAVFDGGSITETCARIVSDEPPALELNDAVLPPRLRAIIARCLTRDPEQRYQNVEELAAALAPLATMHERFRGRSTGAFSRRLLEEELARAKSMSPAARPAPPAASRGVAPLLRALGGKLQALGQVGVDGWLLDALAAPRVSKYVVVALASAILVALVAPVIRGMAWVAPPPHGRGLEVEPLATAAAASSVLATPATAELSAPAPAASGATPAPAASGATLAPAAGGASPVLPAAAAESAASAGASERLRVAERATAKRARPRRPAAAPRRRSRAEPKNSTRSTRRGKATGASKPLPSWIAPYRPKQ